MNERILCKLLNSIKDGWRGGEGKTETTQKRREDKKHENSIKNELKIVA